jgi:methylenetetrahydrofolate dehydrogenase (NADP+) / methenyltetrahydrofolate cyclohydrolase
MSAIRISGKDLAEKSFVVLKQRIAALPRPPKLCVVLVGEHPASVLYIKKKSEIAISLGIETEDFRFPASISQKELESCILDFAKRNDIDGVLIQLPLPEHIDSRRILDCLDPKLDVDGLHPINQGYLLRGTPQFIPCTPFGVLRLIKEARLQLGRSLDLSGLRSTVVGRSVLVGRPMASILEQENTTVRICHSRSLNLSELCSDADILVAAVGKAKLITGSMIKPGAIVIDVGINRSESGKGLIGDVDYEAVSSVAAAVTPVPGGVGPMTIAMLMENTVLSAENKFTENKVTGNKITGNKFQKSIG